LEVQENSKSDIRDNKKTPETSEVKWCFRGLFVLFHLNCIICDFEFFKTVDKT